ncbi:MAG: hypothetical protein KAI17_01300, partial [Thiotrichaceae bacterium]|nr:hypothetical protein [Thiotrichaceae bacterium]
IQGADIRLTAQISNTSKRDLENIALTIPVAAGMEIHSAEAQASNTSSYDYHDIRDDRIHYYFSLKRGESKEFKLLATATYKGHYYLPAINVEAMYDGNIRARQKGQWVDIVKTEEEFNALVNENSPPPTDAVIEDSTKSITVLKAHLYEDANETTRTKMYLILADKVKVLDRKKASDNSRWLFIRFEGKKVLEKWIRAEVTE